MHVGQFVRGKGKFYVTAYVPTSERTSSKYPLLLTTGRVLTQYNVGAQTRRTQNLAWHSEDRLEIHPHDAEARGIDHGDWVGVTSRAGDTVLRVEITDRVAPGVVYTTFHFPESGANLITTENSDWATNCPEYKVTAVQVVKVAQPAVVAAAPPGRRARVTAATSREARGNTGRRIAVDIERLVAMANDIAAFFDADADKAVAAEGVRFHMSRFWEPRMRRAIIAHVRRRWRRADAHRARGDQKLHHPRPIAQINQSERLTPARRADVPVSRPMNSSLAAKLAAKQFVVTGELTPPKGTDLTKLFATAELLRGSVDALNITESPRARMAMDPRAVGKLLQDRGIEVIVQVTSRDRNRIAVQSDLLGAAALGLQELRVHGRRLAGRRRSSGRQAGVRSHGFGPAGGGRGAAQWQGLRRQRAAWHAGPVPRRHGQSRRAQVRGGSGEHAPQDRRGREDAADPGHLPRDQLKRFIDAVKPDGVAMLAGIIPLKSEKSGPWLNANLPGVVVPADMLEAMEQAAKEGRARERGIELAGGVIRDLQGHRAGCAHHGHRRRSRSARDPASAPAVRATRGYRLRRGRRLRPPSGSLPRLPRG